MKSLNPSPLNSGANTASSSSQPHLSRSERERQDFTQRINEILFHSVQLQRTLWLVVREAGGKVTVNEKETDPLWNLSYHRSETSQDLLHIEATVLPEATEIQIAQMVTVLRGKKDHPAKAMDDAGLGEYPTSYVTKKLAPFIIFSEAGVWVDADKYVKPSPKAQEPPQPTKTDAV